MTGASSKCAQINSIPPIAFQSVTGIVVETQQLSKAFKMYGKIFSSMYDGSIYGKWEAIVTFQQMIALADKDGVVDMTAQALSARTSIPIEIIEKGIEILESPDPVSRTPDEDGRRIIRLDQDRPWGWQITNYQKYREIRTAEERREYHRRYYHEKRKKKNSQ